MRIDRASVARDAPELQGKQTTTIASKQRAAASGKAGVALSRTGVGGTAEGSISAERSLIFDETTEVRRDVKLVVVMHSQRQGHDCWVLTPGAGEEILKGRGWDAIKEPRLTLLDKRKSRRKNIDPAIHVEVRCCREDLVIEDIELKDETKQWFNSRAKQANRVAAAESYIRDRLVQTGLEVEPNTVTEKFGELVLARITAAPLSSDSTEQ